MKTIFLDKEGTLVDDFAGPCRFTLRSGAAAALRLLARLDYQLIVVSDQAPIWIRPDGDDIAYLLEACNAFFGTELAPADVLGAYGGVRPLVSTGDTKRSVDISRKAELFGSVFGDGEVGGVGLTADEIRYLLVA